MISLCKRRNIEPLQFWRLANGNVLVFEGNSHTEYSEDEFVELFALVDTAGAIFERMQASAYPDGDAWMSAADREEIRQRGEHLLPVSPRASVLPSRPDVTIIDPSRG